MRYQVLPDTVEPAHEVDHAPPLILAADVMVVPAGMLAPIAKPVEAPVRRLTPPQAADRVVTGAGGGVGDALGAGVGVGVAAGAGVAVGAGVGVGVGAGVAVGAG